MHMKAIHFKDYNTAAKIMKSESPKQQKAYGRRVANYDEKEWEKVRESVMYEAIYAKFRQNPSLSKKLLQTRGTTIAEASPYDRVWGIGLSETDPKANNPALWRGQNLLGQCLMTVRDRIMKDNARLYASLKKRIDAIDKLARQTWEKESKK